MNSESLHKRNKRSPKNLLKPESWNRQPASLVSGDFFHVVRISDQEAGVFICDVMGHGVRSALITAMLRALIAGEGVNLADPGLLMTDLNPKLTAILKQTGKYSL